MSDAHVRKFGPESIGEKIVAEIVKQGMVQLAYHDDEATVFVWNANTYDQLDALVEQYIAEREK